MLMAGKKALGTMFLLVFSFFFIIHNVMMFCVYGHPLNQCGQ